MTELKETLLMYLGTLPKNEGITEKHINEILKIMYEYLNLDLRKLLKQYYKGESND